MYPINENEKMMRATPVEDPVKESGFSQAPESSITIGESPGFEPGFSEAPGIEMSTSETSAIETPGNEASVSESPVNEMTYDAPTYDVPLYSKPTYSEQTHSELTYNAPVYNEPTYGNRAYNESRESPPWNMYSPGICVNQPYPRPRSSDAIRFETQRKRTQNFTSILRAVCLVLMCALCSAAAAYIVMDFRFERGDFIITNQVVLGGSGHNRQDDNITEPVGIVGSEMSAQDIYDMARTQVVVISTEAPGFFGTPDSVSPVSGSGFIISSDGYILTNFHVIELAFANDLPISVALYDGASYEAEVIGFEISNDVAVLKIGAAGLDPTLIGNSDKIRVGQTIYAVGNPFGDLVFTMTDGIVSALDRVVSVEGKSISTFQFSAAVNRGNSGGPVYNSHGEVLGIVTAKVVRGSVEGIGFAIPINDAIEIASELIEHGYISGRPLIGITGQTVTDGHAEYYDWVVGVYIRSISPDSAADAANLEVGDIITAIGGEEVDSMEALKFALRDYNAGDTTTITVWRSGESFDLKITFDEDVNAGRPQIQPMPVPDSPDPFDDYDGNP